MKTARGGFGKPSVRWWRQTVFVLRLATLLRLLAPQLVQRAVLRCLRPR
jgi:hypothetical protein